MLPLFLTPALVLAVCASPAQDPHRQFDFWIGEWSVQNRHIQDDGSWRDGDVTRARITPVIDGLAVLEEWAGPFRGSFMNGFSLRAYDPAHERWSLLLCWTTDGNCRFGSMQGTFRHGRGEFFGGQPPASGGRGGQRYTFSDGLPNSVRWDSSISRDGGRSWSTDWIMEFSRTRAASATTAERLFASNWTEGELSPHPEARELDWMLGAWSGTQTRDGVERPARLLCKTVDKDCLLIDTLAVQQGDGWDKRLAVRGFVGGRQGWESWSVSEHDTSLRRAVGSPALGEGIFTTSAQDGSASRETLTLLADGSFQIEEARRAPGASAFEVLALTRLSRDE